VERILVQRYAAGGRYNVQLLAVEGRLVRRVQTLTLRTDRLDGTGYTVDAVTVTLPALVDEYCRRLMERLRYDGPGCAQFMIDRRTGRMSFLELNPRLGAAFAVAALCAVDFPRLAVQAALEPGAVDSFGPDYAPGKRIAWTYGDLDGIIRALDAGEIGVRGALRWLGQAAASFVTADIHTTWSWRDPAPTLVAYLQLLAGVGRRVVRR
jgi:predicted ATP-grasp superfamily ATP-dependent carboligase